MKTYTQLTQAFLFATLIAIGNMSFALDATQKGLQIAQEADKRDNGFSDSTSSMEMILTNRHGKTSTRKLRNRTLEQKNDGDKSIIIFDNPGDVKGTAFLSHTHKTGSDDQWLYLPALKRVKRIASSNKSGPFMGSEFAYEDIASQEVEKYTYEYLKNEKLNGVDHFVVKSFPVDKKSGYSYTIGWIDTKDYKTSKIEFYDRKKSLLKTLNNTGFKKFNGKHWRPHNMSMKNHQTGKSTVLKFSNYKFKNGLSNKDFNKNALQKLR